MSSEARYRPPIKARLTPISLCRGAGIVFTVVFFVSMLAHIVQVTLSRKWWYSALALGAFGMYSIKDRMDQIC